MTFQASSEVTPSALFGQTFESSQYALPAAVSPAVKDLLVSVLQQSQNGVCVVSLTGDLLFANATGTRALAALGWQRDEESHEAFIQSLQHVVTLGIPMLNTLNFATSERLMCVAMPVKCGAVHAVLLQTSKTSETSTVSTQLFADEFQLTISETKILGEIVRGQKPKQIAKTLGVALSTVITHISAIRHKTKSASVSEVLAKMRGLPDSLLYFSGTST